MSGRRAIFSRAIPAVLLILLLLAVDQAIKITVEATLPMNEAVPVLPFLALYRTWNTGVAFSMLSGMDAWFIVGMRLIIVCFVVWLWRRTPAERWLAHTGFALIIAGAAGNIVDKLLYSHVVDYILFHTGNWSFAVFNLADTFITVGAGLVVLDEFTGPGKAKT